MLTWKRPNENGVSYAYMPNGQPTGVVRYLTNNSYEWEIMCLGSGAERYGKTNTRKLAQDALEFAWMRWVNQIGLLTVAVDVLCRRKSSGADYFVRITCAGREVTPHVFTERWKAEYEVAHYQWVFGLREEKPSVYDYNTETHPDTHEV